MIDYSDVAVIIPARKGSTRLPAKPLKIIGNKTMIEHVVGSIYGAGFENVYVATDTDEIADKVLAAGIKVIMTPEDCPTGTDRVHLAFNSLKNCYDIKYVVNVQGDMPFMKSKIVVDIIDTMKKSDYDIVTAAVKIGKEIAVNESNVKVVVDKHMRAMYFSRYPVPHGAEEFLYHVGVYGFKAESLTRFVELPQTSYELAEKLEQLRAMQHGMSIGICYSDEIPISVDTEEDLAKARSYYETLGK
jgi:3-deoxy-manno-octulosonate cytidylyltransferase (CMP-KDO synthetase)